MVSTMLTFNYRKRGISPRLVPNLGTGTPDYGDTMHRQLTVSGFSNITNGENCDLTTTRELVFSKNVTVEASNSNYNHVEALKWRVSMAATAHHKLVEYSPVQGLATTSFSFGDYSNPEKMAADTTKELSGYRTMPVAGPVPVPGQFYNSSQQKIENNNLCQALGEPKNQQVNVSLLWNRVWWVHHAIKLVEQNGANWNARPALPQRVENQLMGLNNYQRCLPQVQAGQLHHIEIREADLDLIPYIYVLMGSDHNTFNVNCGIHNGVQRALHHMQHRLPLLDYEIYVVDMQSALPNNIAGNQTYPGLAFPGPVANQVVGNFDATLLRRAMLAICSSGCVPGDLEAAWISTSIGVFAENYRGVGTAERVGVDEHHPGVDGLVRGGVTSIPSGSFVCNMFTFLTNGSVATNDTRDIMVKLLHCSESVGMIRYTIEPFILAFQHSARQVGLTGAALFPNAESADIYSVGVNLPPNANSIRRHMYEGLAVSHEMQPSPVMYMTSLILEQFFNCKMPVMMMFYGLGDTAADRTTHFDNTAEWGAKRGQGLVSVHPAQLPNALFRGQIDGLPGIPYKLEEQAAETGFKIVQSGMVFGVRGQGNSIVRDNNVVEFDGGQGMLGHSVILRRDNAIDGIGNAKVILSTAAYEGQNADATISIETEDFPRTNHRAFVPVTAQAQTGWGVVDDICHDHMELYSDFDYLSSKELNLGLSVEDNGDTIANNDVFRGRLPGYIAIAVASGIPHSPVGAIGVFKFGPRKRVKVGETAEGPGAGDAAENN